MGDYTLMISLEDLVKNRTLTIAARLLIAFYACLVAVIVYSSYKMDKLTAEKPKPKSNN